MAFTVVFPRALLEVWNDPIRELNFKCVGTAIERKFSVFLGDDGQQQTVQRLEAKALSWKSTRPQVGEQRSQEP